MKKMGKMKRTMKSMISSFLVMVVIAMILSVPIMAKSERMADESQGKGVKDSSEDRPGQAAQSRQDSIEVRTESAGQASAVAAGKSERLNQPVRLKGLFDNSTQGDMRLEKTGSRLEVRVPQGQEVKEQARMKLRDVSGEEIAELVAEFGPLTKSEQARVEKGEASLRSIRSLRLVSKEKEVRIEDSKGNSHRIKAHVNVGLNSINEDSSLDITTGNELDPDVEEEFKGLAKKNRLNLSNQGGVMKVEKFNLKNGDEVQNATITFKVEQAWLGQGNANNVKIFRYDEGYTEVLPTELKGVDSDGMLVFEGQSDNGLSTFAVFMVDAISDVEDTSFDWGSLKNFLLPVLILVSIGAMFVSSMLKREHK